MEDSTPALCVCVLLYGADEQCFHLAQRVFNTPMLELSNHNVELRIGLNAVGDQTRSFVRDVVLPRFPDAVVIESEENIFKYPMMRRMLHEKPLHAPFTMWFDDDSCFAPDCDVSAWLPRVYKLMAVYTMVGSMYRQKLLGNQAAWLKTQWWFNHKPVSPYIKFITGGWWTIHSSTLLRFDWPLADLRHRGGDVMLGVLCEQHGLPITHFRDGLWINADDSGRESKAPRRGYNERPIGVDYTPGVAAQPLSRSFLVKLGKCCGARCQNCPYDPRHVYGSTQVRGETP